MKTDYSVLKEIKRLKSIKGSGTELISVYMPAGMPISDETNKLREEYSQSSNIKSKTTRTNVLSAIDKIMQYLKLFKETPKNGLVIFCGNISSVSGREDIQLFSIEPPVPLKVNIYRCDSTFLLGPIVDMVETNDIYALLVMDGREATLASLRGSHIQIVKRITSMAHAKVRKGGQSAARYERAIEESIDDYYKLVGDAINTLFSRYDFKIKGLIIGGPGPAKEGFVKANTLNYQIKIIGIFDNGYTDETGLQELLDKASELLKEQEALQERKILERFIQEIARGGLATYGYENVKGALLANKASTLIINKDLDAYMVTYKCNNDGQTFEKIEQGKAREQKHSCGGNLVIINTRDIIEELIDLAENSGAEISLVSDESSYGKEFLMGFKGIGALLRYK
jgi:peptide chain release factor subunit 1